MLTPNQFRDCDFNVLTTFIYLCHYWFRGDWLLGFLYRSSSVQLSVAGLQPINSQDHKIINVDLSSVVSKCVCALRIASQIFVLKG